MPTNLMAQVERDLVDEKPLETILRKLILLGGNAGSPELREWAGAELRGYANGEELPPYRNVNAPIQIDGAAPGAIVRHQTISSMALPDFARDQIDELVPLRMGVREIQTMVSRANAKDGVVKLQPAGASLVVDYMNRTGQMTGHIESLYWSVSVVALDGVLDQIRTRLAELIAELRSSTPIGQPWPSPMHTANAVQLVINGRGNRVNIAQASDNSSIATPAQSRRGFWTTAKVIGAIVVGLATVITTGIALVQFLH